MSPGQQLKDSWYGAREGGRVLFGIELGSKLKHGMRGRKKKCFFCCSFLFIDFFLLIKEKYILQHNFKGVTVDKSSLLPLINAPTFNELIVLASE